MTYVKPVNEWQPQGKTEDECCCLPDTVRMNYFHGQMLSARDLLAEQVYFREKLKLLNRCVHGYGVLCGFEVGAIPNDDDCPPKDQKKRRTIRAKCAELMKDAEDIKKQMKSAPKAEQDKLRKRLEKIEAEIEKCRRKIEEFNDPAQCDDDAGPSRWVHVRCGVAIDCEGNELVSKTGITADLSALLKTSEREKVGHEREVTLYLSICYNECGFEPTRPLALNDCGLTTGCVDARIKEGVRLRASLTPPDEELRCDPCCECCDDTCLLLAAIKLYPEEPVMQDDIDMSVRRPFGLYEKTVITGVNWVHGATYSNKEATELLGTKDDTAGIEVRFSRPVHASTIAPGVIDIWRVNGGRGVAGIITHVEGEYVDLPSNGMVDFVRYRDNTGETVQPGDRLLIIVRGSFILDACCHPVAAAHIGGMIPSFGDPPKDHRPARNEVCMRGSQGPLPWTTDQGATFESWFYIAEE